VGVPGAGGSRPPPSPQQRSSSASAAPAMPQDEKLEKDLADLKRKFRIMQGDKQAYAESSSLTLRKQRAHIDQLKKDNDGLKHELALETRSVVKMNSSTQAEKVAKLQDEADLYTRKIELERRRIAELDRQSGIMQAKILEQRKQLGGVNAARENNAQVAKQIKILENRLDKAIVKFNEALAHNKHLREMIDNLRRERVVFDGIYKKLEKELQEKKKEIASIVEMANIAYEARDQAQAEMSALKAQAEKEEAAFEAEWKELTRMIEEDRKKKEKSEKEKARGDMSIDDENRLRRKVISGNWNIAKDKAQQAATAEKVQSFEEAFEKIKAATEINDIEELVTTFINAEEKNFSLFNYVNARNSEIEKLEEVVADQRVELNSYKSQGGSQASQRERIVSGLDEKLHRSMARADMYEEKHVQCTKTLGALTAGLQSISDKIGCKDMEDTDGTDGADETDMIALLGAIEERTNAILSGALDEGGEEGGAKASILGMGPQTPAGAIHLNVNPPTTGDDFSSDDESDDDDEDRPLTRDELKARTMRRLNKRDTTNKARKSKKR
jgi:hypothetical protein